MHHIDLSVQFNLTCCHFLGLGRDQSIALIAERVSQCLPSLPEVHRVTMLNFIAQTYVHHQQLYQAFLSLPVPKNPVGQLEVEVPPMPLELREGMDIKEWETQRAVRRLASAEEEKLAEIHQLREWAGPLQQQQLEAMLEDLGMLLEGSRGKQVKDLVLLYYGISTAQIFSHSFPCVV